MYFVMLLLLLLLLVPLLHECLALMYLLLQ
jgi:hypothetical protein